MTINLTYIICWMVFGLIAGSIAHFIAPGTSGGFLALICLGIVGAVVGGYLGEVFFGVRRRDGLVRPEDRTNGLHF